MGVFEGKTTVVTGGASGIGRALGAELVANGAYVVLADIDGEGAAQAATELGDAAEGCVLDVRDREAVQAVIDDVADRRGFVDLLFNNAGVEMGGPTHELTGSHWDHALDVNLRGVVNGILAVYPRMVAAGHGHIVNTSSAAGLAAPAFVAPYAASKYGVVGLSAAMRPEAARHGVRISILCPGAVDTPILDRPPAAELPAGASAPVTGREFLRVLGQEPVPAAAFARAAVRQVARNKAVIIVPGRTKALWYLQRLSPALVERVNRRLAAKVARELIRPSAEP